MSFRYVYCITFKRTKKGKDRSRQCKFTVGNTGENTPYLR